MDERERQYHALKEYFDREDMRRIEEKGISVFGTEYGLYGASGLRETYELFCKIHLEKRASFLDLGSGDGRIVLLAALFTHAHGIEGDPALHQDALRAQEVLREIIPQITRASFACSDYVQQNLSSYDTIFIYADHNWPVHFQEKLLRECRCILISLQNIYRPTILPKGKTYWVSQVPYVTYPINVGDGILDAQQGDAP